MCKNKVWCLVLICNDIHVINHNGIALLLNLANKFRVIPQIQPDWWQHQLALKSISFMWYHSNNCQHGCEPLFTLFGTLTSCSGRSHLSISHLSVNTCNNK